LQYLIVHNSNYTYTKQTKQLIANIKFNMKSILLLTMR